MRRVLKIIATAIVLLLFWGLLLFSHDDYDTMENWVWEYGEYYGITFWQDLLGINPQAEWESVESSEAGEDWAEENPGFDDTGEEWAEDTTEEDWGFDDPGEEWAEEEWGDNTPGEEDWGEDTPGDNTPGEDTTEEDWGSDDPGADWGDEDWGDDTEEAWDEEEPETAPENPIAGEDIPEETPQEDDRTRNIRMLARLIYGEARGVDSKVEQAAVAWCALNRMDAQALEPSKLGTVVNQAHFGGYNSSDPVYPHHWELAESIYDAWIEERETGKLSSLRVLPKEYLYYWGTRTHNWFVTDMSYIGSKRKAWSFSQRDPYASARRYYLKRYYPTEEEIEMMAQVLHHKARGVDSEMERAAVIWCILNRVQSPLYEDTVKDVLVHENQFSAYDPELEVRSSLCRLVEDVVERWHREMKGEGNVGRVLPEEYLYFRADEHYEHNEFFIKPNGADPWDWSLFNPYED